MDASQVLTLPRFCMNFGDNVNSNPTTVGCPYTPIEMSTAVRLIADEMMPDPVIRTYDQFFIAKPSDSSQMRWTAFLNACLQYKVRVIMGINNTDLSNGYYLNPSSQQFQDFFNVYAKPLHDKGLLLGILMGNELGLNIKSGDTVSIGAVRNSFTSAQSIATNLIDLGWKDVFLATSMGMGVKKANDNTVNFLYQLPPNYWPYFDVSNTPLVDLGILSKAYDVFYEYNVKSNYQANYLFADIYPFFVGLNNGQPIKDAATAISNHLSPFFDPSSSYSIQRAMRAIPNTPKWASASNTYIMLGETGWPTASYPGGDHQPADLSWLSSYYPLVKGSWAHRPQFVGWYEMFDEPEKTIKTLSESYEHHWGLYYDLKSQPEPIRKF